MNKPSDEFLRCDQASAPWHIACKTILRAIGYDRGSRVQTPVKRMAIER
jgi:hypothetical protein